jgi:hypothetical protein
MKIKKQVNGNVILIDDAGKEVSKVPSDWLVGRDLRNAPMYFYVSPNGSNGAGVVIDHAKVTHLIKDDVESAWSGSADELFSELNDNFFFKVSGGGSTNALFNVKDYGAKGDGSKDDTHAFKNCFAAAVLAKGKVIIPAPNNNGFYKISSTITVKHPTNNECYVDVEGYGVPRSQIRYIGAAGTSCFKLIGLRFSTWMGVKIAMGNNTNTTAVELDTIAPTSSTSFLTFTNCQVALGSGTGQVGWKMGLLSENGGDLSCLLWQNCSVFGSNRDIVGQIGWSIRGSNTLHNVWVQCFGAFLKTMVSNKDGGNGANYFYGMGTSQNNLDFYIQNTSNWIIEGGRYELGRQLLDIGYDNKSPSIILKGLAIGSYDGINGRLIVSDMPCSIEMSGVQVGKKLTGEWGAGTVMLYGGQYGPVAGKGRLIHDGGSVTTTQTNYITKGNATEWLIYRRGVGKMNEDGVVGDIFADLSGG